MLKKNIQMHTNPGPNNNIVFDVNAKRAHKSSTAVTFIRKASQTDNTVIIHTHTRTCKILIEFKDVGSKYFQLTVRLPDFASTKSERTEIDIFISFLSA
jgi:hypothetical protein